MDHAADTVVPLWACAPFVLLLLGIAVLPLSAPHWWEHNRNKGVVAALLGGAAAAWVLPNMGGHALAHTGLEYVSFILLLGSLFVISGGIFLQGDLRATPAVNSAFLAVGGVLASFIGTTGASMLLIRPLLKTNSERRHVVHTVVFFIFIVSNVGGCLSPLGDPPLFLGYLKGVPFAWTFGLWKEWVVVVGALLAIYWVLDARALRRETARDLARDAAERQPLRVQGGFNLALLAGVVATVAFVKEPEVPHADLVRNVVLVALALVSLKATPRTVHEANAFTWGPIVEVAVLFAGIFAAMIPALRMLEQRGGEYGFITEPWHFFWATGLLSSFLDNAPTYLTFCSLAVGVLNRAHEGLGLTADHLGGLLEIDPATHAVAARLAADYLVAISLGAVFMGANTYIGNGPNFMVKAIAESRGVRMPSFFGYMAWSVGILVPLLVIVTWLFIL
jgi:Na+/H+ antiporter NhaD/arsenite permease-like protein